MQIAFSPTSELRGASLLLGLLLLVPAGCPESRSAAPSAAAPEAAPPTPAPKPSELPEEPVLTWYDARGQPHLAASIDEVPEEARGQVVVSELHGGAEVALAETVTVADFRKEAPSYSTIELATLAAGAPLDGEALLAHQEIYVYSAEWCGFCKKVKAFLSENSVPFTERDIEKTPGAAEELKAKAEAAGVEARGIPVTDIHGNLIVGFSPKELKKRLTDAGVVLRPKEEAEVAPAKGPARPPEPHP